jgi:hypothetical protein
MASPDRITLKAYLTPEEYLQVKTQAKNCGVSISDYAKRLLCGLPIKTSIDHDRVLELLKASADLGRLGGLLKLGLSEGRLSRQKGNEVLDEILILKEKLEEKIMQL